MVTPKTMKRNLPDIKAADFHMDNPAAKIAHVTDIKRIQAHTYPGEMDYDGLRNALFGETIQGR